MSAFDYDPAGEEMFDEVYEDGDFERDYSDHDFDYLGEEYYFDDSMDGDHESALASAGWGTDEDYGYFGDDDY